MSDRLTHIIRFYELLDCLADKIGGAHYLKNCNGAMGFPQRGVYFFMEKSEERRDSGKGLRIVRVGTHALKNNSKSSLWGRLAQHRGTIKNGGGNHRGSIFRLLVGRAIIKDGNVSGSFPQWGAGSSAAREVRKQELAMEQEVSAIIGAMPFLWLAINDPANPESLRGYIERNAIALLSNSQKQALDPASAHWLGKGCGHKKVIASGLWNQNHIDEHYDPEFLNYMEKLINNMEGFA